MSQVLVEGWIDIRHSYAIVLRNLVRHWAADPAKHWRFRSTPYLGGWRATTAATDEVVGQARSREWDGRATDVVFRAGHPDTRRPPFPAKVILFLTSESQVLEDFQFAEGGVAQFVVGCREGWLEPLVPSAFSAVALERAGVQRFHLIPLGVDTRVFRPVAPGPPGRPFTFLSVGAMTANKGIDMLLRAFHAVHKAVPETRLILKGLESIYRSTEMFEQAFARFTATWKLPPAEVETLRKALVVRMGG